jgi:hypothetical protein
MGRGEGREEREGGEGGEGHPYFFFFYNSITGVSSRFTLDLWSNNKLINIDDALCATDVASGI